MSSTKKIKKKTNEAAQWARVSELYEKLVTLSPEARVRTLKKTTRGEPAVRREVEFLLENASDVQGFLEDPIGPRAAAAMTQASLSPVFGESDKIGDFLIQRILGSGAFATVYLARQISLDREVALKVSKNVGSEARTMAHLEHDHIVKVYSESIDAKRNLRLICMQYVPGVSLDALLRKLSTLAPEKRDGKAILQALYSLCDAKVSLDPAALRDREQLAEADAVEAALWVGTRLAQALAYAHERGIFHLDVKPSNVIMSVHGRPMLTDFNVALDFRGGKDGALQTTFGGTFDYMAPEQREVFAAKDKPKAIRGLDGRADIYSLGVVLREWLDGAALPRETRAVLARSVETRPADRYVSAKAFSHALEGCNELSAITKALPPMGTELTRLAQRPLLSLTLVGAIPQLIACAVGISYNSLRIVSDLTPAQQSVFHALNLFYNPLVYLVGTVVWIRLVMRLAPYLADPGRHFDVQYEIRDLRRHCLLLPHWGVALTTFGWVPGSIVFPLTLHLKAGPLSAVAFGHLFLSFSLSWLIAMAYSYLLHQTLVLRVLYPRFWMGACDIRRTAREEIGSLPQRLRIFYFLTGLIPLVGAALMLSAGPDMLSSDAYRTFQILVTSLIGLGVLGVFFAVGASQKLTQAVLALTGRK